MLLWLLVAVIPVQGLAAGMMVTCGPNHEGMGQMSDHQQHEAHAGVLEQEIGTGSGDAAAMQEGEESLPGVPEAPERSLSELAKVKCSACAACCVASAIATTVFSFDARVPMNLPTPFSMSTAPVFLTGGLERPPRLFLA